MMALYNHARDTKALYAVGIDSALRKPLGIGNLLCLSVEHLDEVASYNLTFLFGVGDSFEVFEELLRRIDTDNVKSESFVSLHNLLELVFA